MNDRAEGGNFVSARPAKNGDANVRAVNNVLVGKGELDFRIPAEQSGNVRVQWTDLALPTRFDYRLRDTAAAARTAAEDPGRAGDFAAASRSRVRASGAYARAVRRRQAAARRTPEHRERQAGRDDRPMKPPFSTPRLTRSRT